MDSIDYFLNYTDLKYAGYFNKKTIENLIARNLTPRITYVGYATSKLFTSNTAQNLEDDQVDCKYLKQLGPNVISATQLENTNYNDELIFLIYEEQKVLFFIKETKFYWRVKCLKFIKEWKVLW